MVRLERRVGILFFISLLLLSGILLRAVWLQGVEGSTFASQASSQQEDTITVPGLRGSILDRNGRELVGSELGASIYATPYQIKDAAAGVRGMWPRPSARIPADVLEAITQPGGFSYVQRKVDLVRAGRVERLGLEGIGQHPDTLRTRPQGDLAAQVIGAVSAEGKGLTGIEAAEDEVLRGRDGEQHMVKDALGEPIEIETIRDPKDGRPVQLTIDAAIQDSAERALAQVAETHDPVNASAIVMDAKSSEVLAMANWPPVDLDNLDTAEPRGPAERRHVLQLRTGLDVQGLHRRFGAGDGHGHAGEHLHAGSVDPDLRPVDRGVPSARHGDARRRRHPGPVLERRLGDDRPRDGWREVQQVDQPVRLRPADRDRVPGRRERHRASRTRTTPVRPWATCRSARGWP